MLNDLPQGALLNIISWLYPLEIALETIPCVCRPWCNALDSTRGSFWRGLATLHGLVLPAKQGRSYSTRLAADPKRAFRKRRMEHAQAKSVAADRLMWAIWKKLHSSDCVALVHRTLLRANLECPIDHPLRFYENRTLLMLACWRGRSRVVLLLLSNGASPYSRDDRGATPLLMASWAGRTAVVKLLLQQLEAVTKLNRQRLLDERGGSPMTSSCGGRGSKTALCWAERKGFHGIVRLLERAGADTSHRGDAA